MSDNPAEDTSQALMAFQIDGGPADQFEVVRYRGTEGLCQLYRFEIDLVCRAVDVVQSLDDVVGKPAVLSLWLLPQRWFHGIVSRFELINQSYDTADESTWITFRAELVPALWLLSHRYDSRIYQEMSTPEIIADVITRAGLAERPPDTAGLSATYDKREYCVQYRETDLNFICRLMEEEGIWWRFEHDKDGHTLVLADSANEYQPIEGETKLPFIAASGMVETEEHVFRFRLGQSVRPGAVVLNDFNFKNPKLDLKSESGCGRDEALEFSDYPGEFMEQSAGGEYALRRAQEFDAPRIMGVGQSNCQRLAPGRTFELENFIPIGQSSEYLVTSVTHQGKQAVARTFSGAGGRSGVIDAMWRQSVVDAQRDENKHVRDMAEALLQIDQRLGAGDPTAHRALTQWLYHAGQVARDMGSIATGQGGNAFDALSFPNLVEDIRRIAQIDFDAPFYETRFECIPSSVTYRPPRVTPWPMMRGTQTARVVGPEGEEIHTDEYGRVKVRFNWDRQHDFDDTASCWIRVSQGMAGGNYGIMFLPRVGQEVVVDFLEGDPDKPLIVGRVYNKDHMPPYTLPDEKTKSVIKTHSSKGGGGTNEIRFEDLKDEEQLFIQAQKQMDTNVKASHIHTVGGTYDLHVGGKDSGEYRVYVETNKHTHIKAEERTLIEADESHEVKGKLSTKIGGARSTDVGGDVVDKFGMNHKHEVSMTYALKALSIKLEASTGIELKCGGSSIVLTPAAIFVMGGPLVNINCGGGPPVGPVTAMATSPTAPDDPGTADSSEPGKDTTYSISPQEEEAPELEQAPGHEFEEEEQEEVETSWISIELVNEADEPMAGEYYEIKCPDEKQTVLKGTLGPDGTARRNVPGQGTCQVSFPKLDKDAWEKIS